MSETPGSLQCFLNDYVKANNTKPSLGRSGRVFLNELHQNCMGFYQDEAEDCVEMGYVNYSEIILQ